jgi:hypothetical protein
MPDDERAYQERVGRDLAEALRQAFREVEEMPLTQARRAELTRRLLVVTAAAKHDAAGALLRLNEVLGRIRMETADPPQG